MRRVVHGTMQASPRPSCGNPESRHGACRRVRSAGPAQRGRRSNWFGATKARSWTPASAYSAAAPARSIVSGEGANVAAAAAAASRGLVLSSVMGARPGRASPDGARTFRMNLRGNPQALAGSRFVAGAGAAWPMLSAALGARRRRCRCLRHGRRTRHTMFAAPRYHQRDRATPCYDWHHVSLMGSIGHALGRSVCRAAPRRLSAACGPACGAGKHQHLQEQGAIARSRRSVLSEWACSPRAISGERRIRFVPNRSARAAARLFGGSPVLPFLWASTCGQLDAFRYGWRCRRAVPSRVRRSARRWCARTKMATTRG